jgi:uncharacterized protein
MIQVGEYAQVKVLRDTGSGLFLGDEVGNEVLLPGKYIPQGTQVGDTIEVFIYKDKEDRLIATNLKPKVTLHRFAFLAVKLVNSFGAFLDWGLEKDLFVPFSEQPRRMQAGNSYVVYLYVDENTNRLVASGNINRFLRTEEADLEEGEAVSLLIAEPTDLGFNVIINDLYLGLIYHSEVFAPVRTGDTRQGYIKKIREDGKIDAILQKGGYGNIGNYAEQILAKLQAKGGFLPLSDDSSPEQIYFHLEMSKKNFKKAIGLLYKKRIIRLEAKGIYLLSED